MLRIEPDNTTFDTVDLCKLCVSAACDTLPSAVYIKVNKI